MLTMCILRMLGHLSLVHATLLQVEFQSPEFFPHWTYSAGWTHVGLCPKFLVYAIQQ